MSILCYSAARLGQPVRQEPDLGIYGLIAIAERLLAQFRAKAFNIANRPTFLLPIGNAANAAFSQITRAVTSGDLGAQRQFQLALKLVF